VKPPLPIPVTSHATAPGKLVKSFLSTGSLGLSRSVSRVQTLLQSPRYNAADLAEQMRTDPTLTARVMAVANSAFFNKIPCDNITDAVNRLGSAQLTSIFGQVLAGAVLVTPLQGYGLSSQKIWQRAVITGVGTEMAAGRLGEDRSLAYLVGLLHEIGMLMVDRCWSQLADRRYLFGDRMVESDWRLFCTLVRFDAVYHGHFKCNLRRIVDYSNLQGYLLDLYQTPGIADTVNFDHIKRHYYVTHTEINPTQIVPIGPLLDLTRRHGRERLSSGAKS